MGRDWAQPQVVVLAEAAVQAAAPDELWLVEQTCAAYMRRLRRRGRQTRTEDMLGFGLDATVSAAAVAAVGAAQAAVVFLAAQVGDAAREESAGLIQEWVKGLFRRLRRRSKPEPAGLPSDVAPLSPATLKQVREVVYNQACELGATTSQAALMADAIVGRLATGETAGETTGETAGKIDQK
jgi:hypothetical protein